LTKKEEIYQKYHFFIKGLNVLKLSELCVVAFAQFS